MRFAERVLLVVLLLLFVWHGLVPAWRTLNSDFPNYYLAGALYRRGVSVERIYEWTWFQRENDHFGVRQGLVGFAPNPPICALPIAPLAGLSPLTAKRVWLLLNLGFLALVLGILRKVTTFGWRRLILIPLLCIVPLHSNFQLGQFYVLLLLLISAAYYSSTVGKQFLSGVLLGGAAMLKLFPAVFLLLFLWRRNWSAVAGFICSAVTLACVSVAMLGWGIHLVFLSEILPQISRGDWLAPYELWRNSFTTLWSHLFLYEPLLNPSPLINSAVLYVVAMSATTTALLVGLALALDRKKDRANSGSEWAALVPLCLLLSSTTGTYHATILIFTAVVGLDALLAQGRERLAIVLFVAFLIACAPIPTMILLHSPLRLVAISAIYIVMLYGVRTQFAVPVSSGLLFAAVGIFLVFIAANSRPVQHRGEDFPRRLVVSWSGLRTSNVVPVAGKLAMIDMQQSRYAAIAVQEGTVRNIPVAGDALSLSGSNESPLLYVEDTGQRSTILRLPIEPNEGAVKPVLEGHDPAVSADGEWLVFLRDTEEQPEAWITRTRLEAPPQLILPAAYHPLEVTVSSSGDVVAAVGPANSPHLVMLKHDTRVLEAIDVTGAVRYPALSPDGERLAFSRREHGMWHLFVRDLRNAAEEQLTHSACNATYSSWLDANTLLYATDCGRGVGLTAIARVHP